MYGDTQNIDLEHRRLEHWTHLQAARRVEIHSTPMMTLLRGLALVLATSLRGATASEAELYSWELYSDAACTDLKFREHSLEFGRVHPISDDESWIFRPLSTVTGSPAVNFKGMTKRASGEIVACAGPTSEEAAFFLASEELIAGSEDATSACFLIGDPLGCKPMFPTEDFSGYLYARVIPGAPDNASCAFWCSRWTVRPSPVALPSGAHRRPRVLFLHASRTLLHALLALGLRLALSPNPNPLPTLSHFSPNPRLAGYSPLGAMFVRACAGSALPSSALAAPHVTGSTWSMRRDAPPGATHTRATPPSTSSTLTAGGATCARRHHR